MKKDLPENTANQISLVSINRDKPLIISDADEVLVVFMARFELFLKSQDYFFDWSSFRLTGNIHRKSDNYTFSQKEVLSLLDSFFEEETLDLDAVPGAIKALRLLSSRAQVVILSNVPSSYRNKRRTQRQLVGKGVRNTRRARSIVRVNRPPYPGVAGLMRDLRGKAEDSCRQPLSFRPSSRKSRGLSIECGAFNSIICST